MTIFAVLCLGAFARIPRLVHFVRTDEGRPTLSYAESVALCSARKYIGETWLHSELPPTGAEWMRVNETCGVVWREATPPRALPSGVALERAAHRADFLRLDLLLRHGGIYFDTDVVVFARIVNHIGSLLAEHDVVVGEQPSELSVYGEGFSETSGVCNAVLMAAPSSPFIQRFLEESIRHFTPGCWDCHSIKTLTRVVAAHRAGGGGSESLRVLSKRAFFPLSWSRRHVFRIFRGDGGGPAGWAQEGLGVHLWHSTPLAKMLASQLNQARVCSTRAALHSAVRRVFPCPTRPLTLPQLKLEIRHPREGALTGRNVPVLLRMHAVAAASLPASFVICWALDAAKESCSEVAPRAASGRNESVVLMLHALAEGSHIFRTRLTSPGGGTALLLSPSAAVMTVFVVADATFVSSALALPEPVRRTPAQLLDAARRARPLNVLFVHSLLDHVKFMHRPFEFLLRAAERHSHMRVFVYHGDEVNGTMAIVRRIESDGQRTVVELPPTHRFDAVLTFDRCGEIGIERSTFHDHAMPGVDASTTRVRWEHECRFDSCGECAQRADVFLAPYVDELAQFEPSLARPAESQRVVVRTVHTAEPQIFEHSARRERDIAVLLTGRMDPDKYAFRRRLARLLPAMCTSARIDAAACVLRAHPGYWDQQCSSLASCAERGINKSRSVLQTKDYASQLARARVVLVTSSTYRYPLAKYVEAAMAGALIVGDMPFEQESHRTGVASMVVELAPEMTDAQIVSTVGWWLAHDAERWAKAEQAQQLALSSFTWDHKLEAIVVAIAVFRQGGFGTFDHHELLRTSSARATEIVAFAARSTPTDSSPSAATALRAQRCVPNLLIGVKSAAQNLAQRRVIRETWWSGRVDLPCVRLAFIVGNDPSRGDALRAEHARHRDLLLPPHLNESDTYRGLINKTRGFLRWAQQQQQRNEWSWDFVFVADDDVYLRVDALLAMLRERQDGSGQSRRLYLGQVWAQTSHHANGGLLVPTRNVNSKYYVSLDDYPGKAFPEFAVGPHFILGRDCVHFIVNNERVLGSAGHLEDVSVALWLGAMGVWPEHTSRFINSRDAGSEAGMCTSDAISIADLSPNTMRLLDANTNDRARTLCDGFLSARLRIVSPKAGARVDTPDIDIDLELASNSLHRSLAHAENLVLQHARARASTIDICFARTPFAAMNSSSAARAATFCVPFEATQNETSSVCSKRWCGTHGCPRFVLPLEGAVLGVLGVSRLWAYVVDRAYGADVALDFFVDIDYWHGVEIKAAAVAAEQGAAITPPRNAFELTVHGSGETLAGAMALCVSLVTGVKSNAPRQECAVASHAALIALKASAWGASLDRIVLLDSAPWGSTKDSKKAYACAIRIGEAVDRCWWMAAALVGIDSRSRGVVGRRWSPACEPSAVRRHGAFIPAHTAAAAALGEERRSDNGKVLWWAGAVVSAQITATPTTARNDSDSAALRDMWEAQHARFLPEVLQRKKSGEDIALSGPGSTLAFTARIRVHLREWFERFGVRSIVDVGCGDMTWLPSLNLSGVEYRGFDISRVVVRHNNERFQADARFANRFAVLDLRSQIPPRADMVIARDVLFHLPPAVALAALRNINASGARYLVTTTYLHPEAVGQPPTAAAASNPNVWGATPEWGEGAGFFHIDLSLFPFELQPPLAAFVEGIDAGRQRMVGVWALPLRDFGR